MSVLEDIHVLNLPTIQDEDGNGICLTRDLTSPDKFKSPEILFALETAKEKFKADAVFFRKNTAQSSTIPQFYIFDYSHRNLDSKDRKKIHISMWNGGIVPAYMIIEKSMVSIYDSRQTPSMSDDKDIEAIITVSYEIFRQVYSENIANGLFWEGQNKNTFSYDNSAAKELIEGLKKVYDDFQLKSGIDRHVALRLLVQCLLIKYLEERDEENENGYFATTYFKQNFNCNSFCETIRKGYLLELLDLLATDFNGKVFEWTDFSQRNAIKETQTQTLADYLDANIKDNQYLIWRMYSFAHLPIEVISTVYEELLANCNGNNKRKDIVYTPEMIVSTLVDECMPIIQPRNKFKIIDASCGSGIFLVKTYKRIVQWWRYERWLKSGQLQKPSISELKALMRNSIYGLDIEEDAVNLTIFSMALAMLDEVNLNQPTWETLKFQNLEDNIVCRNFFDFISNNRDIKFDLVIGNPPFNAPLKDGIEPTKDDYFSDLENKCGYNCDIKIPDNNIALHFLYQSLRLLKKDGLLCLIQPSTPLIYSNHPNFKKEIFGKYNLLQIIDFTKLSNVLWGTKTNVPTAAVFIQNAKPDSNNVMHLVADRTFANRNKLFLEFDHYDFHYISKYDAIYNSFCWKSNLYGGNRVANITMWLSKLRNLREYCDENIGWICGEGFMASNGNHRADYITGHDYIGPKAIIGKDIIAKEITKCSETLFHRAKNKSLYEPPHLLFRKSLGDGLNAAYSERYLTFKNTVYAIHAPQSDAQKLMNISDYIERNKSLLHFYIFTTSPRAGTIRETSIYNTDIESIPYEVNLSYNNLSETDKVTISDALDDIRRRKNDTSLYSDFKSIQIMYDYSHILCHVLNSVYQTRQNKFGLKSLFRTDSYYIAQFEYGRLNHTQPKWKDIDFVQEYLSSLSENKYESTKIHKILKIYKGSNIIFIKPRKLKYWRKSIALRDADEIITDFLSRFQQDA